MLCLKFWVYDMCLITQPSTGTDEVTSQICITHQFQRIAISTNQVTVWTIVMSHMKLILSQELTWFLLLPLIMILNTRLELQGIGSITFTYDDVNQGLLSESLMVIKSQILVPSA
jgi:hypothetical protein